MAVSFRSVLTQAIPKEHRWKLQLYEAWEAIIGPLKGKVKIEKIEGDTLFLAVCHPSWAQELFLLSNMLKKKINLALNSERIKNIHFKTTSFNFTEKTQTVTITSAYLGQLSIKPQTTPVKLTKKEQEALGGVECDDLRKMLQLFYASCKRRTAKRGMDEQIKNSKKSVDYQYRTPSGTK
jgi:hypothetical protein